MLSMRKFSLLVVGVLLAGCNQNSQDGGGPAAQQQEEPVAAHEPTTCELIDRGEMETRAQCDSGKLGACREIAGWVRNRIMEGCGANKLASSQAPEPELEPVAVAAPTACELIDRGEAETRAQCDSGKLGACREIAGWVRNRVMEGCGASKIASPAASAPASPSPQAAQPENAVASEQKVEIPEKAVEGARVRSAPPPRYPPAAFRAGIQGTVRVIVDVDAEGGVTNVVVETSSRNRDLDRAAIEAARKWTFYPAMSASGKPVPSRMRNSVDFAVSDDTPKTPPEDEQLPED